MTTINDVARVAGVSRATVSNFLRGNLHLMSVTTRDRVARAIDSLDYQPNALAQGLRAKRTRTIAVLIPNIDNPFFGPFVRGVQDVAQPHGDAVWLGNSDGDSREETHFIRLCRQRQVDGVILSPTRLDADGLAAVIRDQLPLVCVGPQITLPHVDTVAIDAGHVGYDATRHLLSLGRRTIGIISGPRALGHIRARLHGYSRALSEAGVAAEGSWIRDGEVSFAGGYARARALCAETPFLDGVIVTQNQIALGAMVALRDSGVTVPDDVAAVALDDGDAYLALTPPLSGIVVPQYEMGKRSAELLIERINAATTLPARHVLLPHRLVVRESTVKSAGVSARSGAVRREHEEYQPAEP